MKWYEFVRQEPVRMYIYSLLAVIIGALVYFGVVTSAAVPILMGVVLTALALPSPVEMVRNRVSPVPKEDPVNIEERQ